MENVTTSNVNEDVLLKDKEHEYLCLIDEEAEVGETGTEEVHINEEVKLVMDQSHRATQKRVLKRNTLTILFHNGSLQVLPPKWKFQIMPCKQLIDNWCVENKRGKIPLLEVLSALYVAHLGTLGNWNTGELNPRHMICVMTTLMKYSNEENFYLIDKNLWTSEYTKSM